MTTRRFLVIVLLSALVYSSPQWMHEEAAAPRSALAESARDLRASSGASTAARDAALQRVLRDAERERESLTSEQIAMIDDLRTARGDARRERAVEGLLATLEEGRKETLTFYQWAAGAWRSLQETYRDVQPQARAWLWISALAVVIVGVSAALRSRVKVARWSATLGFRISRVWLVVLSFVSIALAMATRTNPWPAVPSEIVVPPLVALVGCAFALRLVDFNYPVWNSLIRGCGAPLISMGFVVTYLKLV